jgi:hypothetical protein
MHVQMCGLYLGYVVAIATGTAGEKEEAIRKGKICIKMIFLEILNFNIRTDMQNDGSTHEIHSTASTGSSQTDVSNHLRCVCVFMCLRLQVRMAVNRLPNAVKRLTKEAW